MKLSLFFTISILLLGGSGWSQDKHDIVFNPVKNNEEDLKRKMYQYPQFVSGKAFYKNGTIAEAKFNYNYLNNQVLFIDPKGDTLALFQGGDFTRITIQTDTFCYYKKEFVQQITHYSTHNLFIKNTLQNTAKEKKGAYDSYSSTSAITSITMVDIGTGTIRIASDENIIFTFKHSYFLSDRFNRFYPATRKGIYDLFSKNEKQIKDFLEKNEINFSKKEDLVKLLEFTNQFEK